MTKRINSLKNGDERWRNVYSEMEAINIIADRVNGLIIAVNEMIPYQANDVVLVPGKFSHWLGVIYMVSGGVAMVECKVGLVPVNVEDLTYVGKL